MPEGHTLFALARDLDTAFRGTSPVVTSYLAANGISNQRSP